jgi:hypothetical protein
MMRLRILFTTALLAFLILLALYTLSYPFEAQLFPWVIGIPATILMLIQALKEISQLRHATKEKVPAEQAEGDYRAHILIIVWMAGFLITIYILGFLIVIPLFLFLYLKINGLGWFQSLGIAAVLIIFIYCIFALALNMRLYPGILFS